MPVLHAESLIDERVQAIRAMHREAGIDRAELDVSGGIDSAVMCGLLCRALGPTAVVFVYSGIHSSDQSRRHAQLVTEAFGARLTAVDVTEEYTRMAEKIRQAMIESGHDARAMAELREGAPAVDGSFRSCLRAPIGRYANRLFGGGIRHGTGNECEDRFVRFYQKGGDGEVDSNPIAMLSKGEVYQLARALRVPRDIIDCEPTHDLHRGQETSHDEVELERWTGVPWTYSRIDAATGSYRRVGTIERMSRLIDRVLAEAVGDGTSPDDARFWGDPSLHAVAQGMLDGAGLTPAHLVSAIRLEAQTRHKMNPNCPTLGDRWSLVRAGILSNELEEG